MIVKVQVPIVPPYDGDALIYDKRRTVERMVPATPEIRGKMGRKFKIYCEATIENDAIVLGKVVADQPW